MKKMIYEIISNNKCLLGESPIWHHDTNTFIWLDYLNSKIYSYNLIKNIKSEKYLDLVNPLGGIVLYDKLNCLLVAHKDGISTIDIDTLETSDFIHPESSKNNVIYNDLKIDRHHNLWISTSHIDETEEKGSLWRLDNKGVLQLIDTGFIVSNGPAFSPCGNFVYFNDTFSYKTYRYRISKDKINSIKKELFYTFDIKDGYPDGITVDDQGGIWIAHWGSGIISKQSQNGTLLNKYYLPSINLTSLCFGGNHLNYLIVTSATDGMDEKDWDKYPESGKTFLLKTEEKGIMEKSYII